MSHLPFGVSIRNLIGYLIIASFFVAIFVVVWLTYGLVVALGGGACVVGLAALLILAIDLITEPPVTKESHDDRGPRRPV